MAYLSIDAEHKPTSAKRWLQVVLHGGKGIVVVIRRDVLPEMPTVFISSDTDSVGFQEVEA